MQPRTTILLALGVAVVATAAGYAVGHTQVAPPTMYGALGDLQRAQAELQLNTLDYGGHRVKALNLVNQALVEVKTGIDADIRGGAIGVPFNP